MGCSSRCRCARGARAVERARPSFDEDLGPPRRLARPGRGATHRDVGEVAARRSAGRQGAAQRDDHSRAADRRARRGPGAFLRPLEVAAYLDGERFIGWELVQLLDRTGRSRGRCRARRHAARDQRQPAVAARPAPGAVGRAAHREGVDAELWRGDNEGLELKFATCPQLDARGSSGSRRCAGVVEGSRARLAAARQSVLYVGRMDADRCR